MRTEPRGLERGLGLFDSMMIVAGSMIGSGVFIVASEMGRELGGAGWLMVAWVITGVLTVTAALSYGELAAMMPQAGGQYVYLREAYSPLWGFLYGWTLFAVIQTGTIAAVAVAFARYLGVLWPWVSESRYLMGPVHVLPGYAVSLSTAQAVAFVVIVLLTLTNARGLKYGKGVQNVFTTMKIAALLGVIAVGCFIGWNAAVVRGNWGGGHAWRPAGVLPLGHGLSAMTGLGIFVALCTSQIGSLFSSDAWNNITFSAGEVRRPSRNVPLALLLGTTLVIGLYMLANFAYTAVLPFAAIQHAASDRVAAAMLAAVWPGLGPVAMAAAIMVSTFGCMNGMILSGARAYYAMALDGVFFRRAGALNGARVPGAALAMQCLWSVALVTVRTYDARTGSYGNLYSDLLDYVISAALLFYILTIAGIFRLRRTRPEAERPYRAWGYPWVPGFYIVAAAVITGVLFVFKPATTAPGVAIVLIGVPVYWLFRRGEGTETSS